MKLVRPGAVDSPDPEITMIEAKENEPLNIPAEYHTDKRYTKTDRGKLRHSDILDFIRTNRGPQNIHSDGFLSFAGLTEPAYSCPECGFNGFFSSSKCDRCGVVF